MDQVYRGGGRWVSVDLRRKGSSERKERRIENVRRHMVPSLVVWQVESPLVVVVDGG